MSNQGYGYKLGMAIFSYFPDMNPANAMVNRLGATEDGQRIVKDRFNLAIMDAWH